MAPKNPNRDYEAEARWAKQPKQKKAHRERMRARRLMEKKGLVKKHDGKEVDHKKYLGGKDGKVTKETASPSNYRVVSKETNRKKQPKRK